MKKLQLYEYIVSVALLILTIAILITKSTSLMMIGFFVLGMGFSNIIQNTVRSTDDND